MPFIRLKAAPPDERLFFVEKNQWRVGNALFLKKI